MDLDLGGPLGPLWSNAEGLTWADPAVAADALEALALAERVGGSWSAYVWRAVLSYDPTTLRSFLNRLREKCGVTT